MGGLAHICSFISTLTQQILRLLAAFHFSPRSFSLLLQIPFTYFGDFSLSLRVCVCVFGGISKPRSRGGSGGYATLVIYKPSSLFPFLPFLPSFPSSCLLPIFHLPLSLLAPDNMQSEPDFQTLPVPTSLPTDYNNAAVFPLNGHLDNCDRWLLLQRAMANS